MDTFLSTKTILGKGLSYGRPTVINAQTFIRDNLIYWEWATNSMLKDRKPFLILTSADSPYFLNLTERKNNSLVSDKSSDEWSKRGRERKENIQFAKWCGVGN